MTQAVYTTATHIHLDDPSGVITQLEKAKKGKRKICILISLGIIAIFLVLFFFGPTKTDKNDLCKYETAGFECLSENQMQGFRERFAKFQQKYNRTYLTFNEKAIRFILFVHNVLEFEAEERLTPDVDYDENGAADRADSELTSSATNFPYYESIVWEKDASYIRPVRVNWTAKGKVTAVKNQGICGSCYAMATASAIESQYAIKRGELLELSVQNLMDCNPKNNGCKGGWMDSNMEYARDKGIHLEKDYPYVADNQTCNLVPGKDKIYIDDFEYLPDDEDQIADYVAKNGPVTFAMQLVKKMYFYHNGVFNPTKEECAKKSIGIHALTIVGYGTEAGKDYWLVKNSWGTSWGQGGYMKLARGVNACRTADYVVAPVIN